MYVCVYVCMCVCMHLTIGVQKLLFSFFIALSLNIFTIFYLCFLYIYIYIYILYIWGLNALLRIHIGVVILRFFLCHMANATLFDVILNFYSPRFVRLFECIIIYMCSFLVFVKKKIVFIFVLVPRIVLVLIPYGIIQCNAE